MPFKPLLEIRVEHPFFESGLCTAAQVNPDAASSSRLRGLRLIARQLPGRLTLIADFTEAGETRVAIPDVTLAFSLKLDRNLLSATDLAGLSPGTIFIDSGAGKPMKPVVRESRSGERLAKPAGTVTLALSGRPLPGSKAVDFHILDPAGVTVKSYDGDGKRITLDGPAADIRLDYPISPPGASGALAGIEVAIGPAIAAKAAAGKPPAYAIALKAVSAPWCYHLVTDLPNPLAEWTITHAAADGPAADFGSGGIAEISAADPNDPFGSDLLRRSAPLRVLRFVSDTPVPCTEKRARRIALLAGDRQLFTALPNPSPDQIRLLKGKPAFGEVLRFVTV
jgi:hypothetical protein